MPPWPFHLSWCWEMEYKDTAQTALAAVLALLERFRVPCWGWLWGSSRAAWIWVLETQKIPQQFIWNWYFGLCVAPAGDAEMLPCAGFSQASGKVETQDYAFCGASAWRMENMISKKQQRLETNVGEKRPPWLAGVLHLVSALCAVRVSLPPQVLLFSPMRKVWVPLETLGNIRCPCSSGTIPYFPWICSLHQPHPLQGPQCLSKTGPHAEARANPLRAHGRTCL